MKAKQERTNPKDSRRKALHAIQESPWSGLKGDCMDDLCSGLAEAAVHRGEGRKLASVHCVSAACMELVQVE